jgi:hypothetical protein
MKIVWLEPGVDPTETVTDPPEIGIGIVLKQNWYLFAAAAVFLTVFVLNDFSVPGWGKRTKPKARPAQVEATAPTPTLTLPPAEVEVAADPQQDCYWPSVEDWLVIVPDGKSTVIGNATRYCEGGTLIAIPPTPTPTGG